MISITVTAISHFSLLNTGFSFSSSSSSIYCLLLIFVCLIVYKMFILHFVVFTIAFGYDGLCHYRCDGCTGPTSTDCIDCVQNGHKENEI